MARKKPKGPPPTVNEILSMGTGELSKLTEKDMRAYVNVLVSAGNKRIRRLQRNQSKGIAPEALRGVMESGGVFSAKGKNRNQLFREMVRARNFFESPLSTVKGAMEERKRRERLLWGETREERKKRLKKEEKERKKKAKRKKQSKKPQEAEPENEYQEESNFRTNAYETDDWNPDEQLKNTFKAFRMFKSAYPHLFKTVIDSETLISMMGEFVMSGLSPEEAVSKAYADVMSIYEDEEAARQEADSWEWKDVF